MMQITKQTIEDAERIASKGKTSDALAKLRDLSVDEIGNLLLDGLGSFPKLAKVLPRMASNETQVSWTGSHGHDLLRQSIAFARTIEGAARRYSNLPLAQTNILDYGCGWGRLLRLMLKVVPPEQLYGMDPWDRSLEICREDGVLGHLGLSEYLPKTLPFGDVKFGLAYAFSVFTHTSRRATFTALAALRPRMEKDGLLAITIRPVEYWEHHNFGGDAKAKEALVAAHNRDGFAFLPHQRASVDGDVTYGDTSMTLDFLDRNAEGWRRCGRDWNAGDPFQYVVFLKPVA